MQEVRINTDYYFTDGEYERIGQAADGMLAAIKEKGLTFAEAFEALEQCKTLIEKSFVK